MKRALLLLVLAGGCTNESPFTKIPPRERPVALVTPGTSALDAFVTYEADGTASYDPDGVVVEWHWTIETKPTGSGMEILEAIDAPLFERVRFRPDLVGGYRVTLVVVDDDGLESEPASWDFSVTDASGLRLELTWDRDITDVDLHLVSEEPGASFFAEPWDCYFQNEAPDWGVPGFADDDPYLPMDDDDGFGPEVIGLRAPAAGTYRIYTHYYCDDGFGGTQATLRVMVNGTSLAESTANLVRTGDLWEVATLTFDGQNPPVLVMSTTGVGTSTHGCS